MKGKTLGSIKDLTKKYNAFLNDEFDKRKSNNDSKGELINGSKKNRYINNIFNLLVLLLQIYQIQIVNPQQILINHRTSKNMKIALKFWII